MGVAGGRATPLPPTARLVAPAAEVDAACRRLAAELQGRVDQGACVLLGILLGGMFPLVRIGALLEGDFRVDVCRVTRYGDSTRGGELQWLCHPRMELKGRHIVLIDDIFDQGFTLEALLRHCLKAGAASVASAVLVRKRHGRPLAPIEPDHVGLEVDDIYVFGCGMDYRGGWRHLPALYGLDAA